MRARALIQKADRLWRGVARKMGNPDAASNARTFDKVDKKDEVMAKSQGVKKLMRAKETKLDRQFGGEKLLARKLRELP